MTLERPMFPPRADLRKCSQLEHFSTGIASAPVENGAALEPFFGGAAAAPPKITSDASQSDLYFRTDMSPEEVFQALGRLRSEAEAAVERLIALIDELDGDADREPVGDEFEPSLGAPENHPNRVGYLQWRSLYRDRSGSQLAWAGGNDDEREGGAGHDDREGDELEHGGDEHDGREPDTHEEPSLGWTACEAASGRYGGSWGANIDLELEFHTGIADIDGLMEQVPAQYDRANVGVIG